MSKIAGVVCLFFEHSSYMRRSKILLWGFTMQKKMPGPRETAPPSGSDVRLWRSIAAPQDQRYKINTYIIYCARQTLPLYHIQRPKMVTDHYLAHIHTQ